MFALNGDGIWRGLTWTAGVATVVILGGVAAFLVIDGVPALRGDAGSLPQGVANIWRLTWPLLFGSAWAAAWALLLAVPIGVGSALFITMVAPRRLGGLLGGAIDLLAAVPSVVYGLWGIFVVAPVAAKAYAWLSAHFGWFPLFAGMPSATGRTLLTASLVLAIMVVPLISSLSREVIALVPKTHIEASLALGATRWQAIRQAVLPQAKSGIAAGALLAMGRALGETMAVAMVLSSSLRVSLRLITSENPGTVAGFIAQNFPDASGLEVNALLWLGLMLFVLTLLVNTLARSMLKPTGFSRPKAVRRHRRPVWGAGRLDSAAVVPSAQAGVPPTASSVMGRGLLARRIDKFATAVFWLAAIAAAIPLVGLLWTTISRGLTRLDATFFTQSMRGILNGGGGALHAIVGTLLITLLATVIAAPLGVVTALWLVEEADRSSSRRVQSFARVVRLAVDVMTGIPSIVAGLTIYALISLVAGPGLRSGLAGSLALAIIMLPVVVRAGEEVLVRVPDDLREGALALGSRSWRVATQVVLPTARPGLVSAVVLGISRIIGETAPLLLVAGFTDAMNYNLFSGRMMSLPVYIYSQWQNKGVDAAAYNARAWTAALVLVALVLLLQAVARLVAKGRKTK